MFNWLANIFRRTEIPHRAEVERIAAEVLASKWPNPCARIAGRIVRLYLAHGIDATIYTGDLLANDPRIRAGKPVRHAVVVLAIGKSLWQLDATRNPIMFTKKRPVWQPNTEEVIPRNEIVNAVKDNIWW